MATFTDLLLKERQRVQAALNVLLESPYFYRSDDEDLYLFIRRYQREFTSFFSDTFGWKFISDNKCARVYKENWFNERITPGNRDLFNFTRRDECLAFMLLLEFFEKRLQEEAIGVDDQDNPRFAFGDLLKHAHERFNELYPDQPAEYSEENVRRILRQVMPQLERYRFLARIDPPADMTIKPDDFIYECLPALWHYSVQRISRPLHESDPLAAAAATADTVDDLPLTNT